MTDHPVVSRDEWLDARKDFLKAEKEFTRQRDDISRRRRALPWVRVETDYEFDTSDGKQSLAEGFDGAVTHLAQRDVTFPACSRAPLDILQAFRDRMGWRFPWVSSLGSSFNEDYHVTFSDEECETETAFYN